MAENLFRPTVQCARQCPWCVSFPVLGSNGTKRASAPS